MVELAEEFMHGAAAWDLGAPFLVDRRSSTVTLRSPTGLVGRLLHDPWINPTAKGVFVPRLVQLRTEARVRDDAQLLVRFNDDADVANALRLALADAHRYRVLPGHAEHGAATVSVFLVTGTTEARTPTAGIGQQLFGLADAATARAAGFDVLATAILEDGEPLPFSDRHADLIVAGYRPVSCPTSN